MGVEEVGDGQSDEGEGCELKGKAQKERTQVLFGMEKGLPCETEGGAEHDGEEHRGSGPGESGHRVAHKVAHGKGEGNEIDEGGAEKSVGPLDVGHFTIHGMVSEGGSSEGGISAF